MYSIREYNLTNHHEITMPTLADTKEDRLQVRLNTDAKLMLQRAAGYNHKTVSQFVLTTALAEAERVIREHESIALSAADWKIFHEALNNPPPPNAALRAAFAKYKRAGG
jgi:uncharacterized protein (DUF1778 family)